MFRSSYARQEAFRGAIDTRTASVLRNASGFVRCATLGGTARLRSLRGRRASHPMRVPLSPRISVRVK